MFTRPLSASLLLLAAGCGSLTAEDRMDDLARGISDWDLRFSAGYQQNEIESIDTDGFRIGIGSYYLFHLPEGPGLVLGAEAVHQHFTEDNADMDILTARLRAGPSFRFNRHLHLELTPYAGAGWGWFDDGDAFILPYGCEVGLYATLNNGFQLGGRLGYEWMEIDGETDSGVDIEGSGDGLFAALSIGVRF